MDRRALLKAALATSALCSATLNPFMSVQAQPQPSAPFNPDMVTQRAKELAQKPFDPQGTLAPDVLRNLNFDAYRDLRFRPERALLAESGAAFRMQMFHLGFLYNRAVTVNVVRDGLALPVPYAADFFDYGRNKFDPALPSNLGFSGFRLHYPLNAPDVFDELISFIGASYFRVLGRDQKYGLSARGLAIDTALPSGEEFPFFREFWIEDPKAGMTSVVIHALLDTQSMTGAYRFTVTPGSHSMIEVATTLFVRKPVKKLGLAPLTSMYFYGENQQRPASDYCPEAHDSDGLLMQTGSGEWLWRPLRNPHQLRVSAFMDQDVKGFGLMQRDRHFSNYQDLALHYEMRPSYWVEPVGNWGAGFVELVEIPTPDETNDNIVAYWVPKTELKAGETLNFSYRLHSLMTLDAQTQRHPGGRVINTYVKKPVVHEAPEATDPSVRRFLIDFAGGDVGYYAKAPADVVVVPSASSGTILRSFVVENPQIQGFRAIFDFKPAPNINADLRAFLKTKDRALTETWTFPWRHEA